MLGPEASLEGYQLILVPSLLYVSDDFAKRLKASKAHILAGPRTGLKTADFQLPDGLTTTGLQELTGFRTTRIDALPARLPIDAEWQDSRGRVSVWREEGIISAKAEGRCSDGLPLLSHGNQASYLTAWPDEGLLKEIVGDAMSKAGIARHNMPAYMRVRQRGHHLIFTHYGPQTATIPDSFDGEIILGHRQMSQADVTIMKID